MAYFECMVGSAGGGATITVTYSSSFYNKTMTCSNGTKTYTKTTTNSGSTEFKVSDEGTWTITCNGVSRTVNVVLNYTTQMAVTKTITVYGAAGATISYTDAIGSKTVTLNNSGTNTTPVAIIPPSQTITFTDTNKSKNPSNLSQNYSKSITITESTTSIDIMPVARSKVLYWYGYKGSLESCTRDNGWTDYASEPTYNTNDIQIFADTGFSAEGVSSNSTVTTTKGHWILKSYGDAWYGLGTAKNIISNTGGTSNGGVFNDSNTSIHHATVTPTNASTASYVWCGMNNAASRKADLYAMWYE